MSRRYTIQRCRRCSGIDILILRWRLRDGGILSMCELENADMEEFWRPLGWFVVDVGNW
jgi:hypothetical protein